jgi:sarcosine oxidase
MSTRAGISVAVVEQFAPGHARGSSHGSARIVRRGYGDAFYSRLAGRAFELWRELEDESGTTLLRMTGGLDFGSDRNVPAIAAGLAECAVEHEVLPPEEAERRWPGMRFDGPVVFHAQAGTVDAAAAVDAMLAQAARRGAVVRHGSAVAAIEPSSSSALVRLEDGSALRAGHVVVAAGAWITTLLCGLVPLPSLTITQQQIFHFPRLEPDAPAWPSVIHEAAGHGWYHLAGGRDGGPGDDRKIGEHDQGTVVTADGRDGVVDPRSRGRVIEYVKRWLPGLDPTPRGEATCLYTTTPDEDFVLDRAGPLIVCSPCSGHGAKFAPLIGELSAGLALGTADVPDRFRLDAPRTRRSRGASL